MSDLKDLTRDELKKYIKDNKLGVKVTPSKDDEKIREEILEAEANVQSGEGFDAEEKDTVVFYSPFLGRHIGEIKFVEGLFETDDPKKIEILRNHGKFGIDLFEKK